MDVDPNYDPSDFLLQGLPQQRNSQQQQQLHDKIHDDLEVSESDDEAPQQIDTLPLSANTQQIDHLKKDADDDDDGGDLWF